MQALARGGCSGVSTLTVDECLSEGSLVPSSWTSLMPRPHPLRCARAGHETTPECAIRIYLFSCEHDVMLGRLSLIMVTSFLQLSILFLYLLSFERFVSYWKRKKKSEKGQNFCILVHPSTMYMFNTWCVGHSPLTNYMWSHPLLFYSLSVLSLRVPPCTIKMLLSPRSTLVTTHVRKNTHLHNFNVCVPEQGAGNDASLKVHAEFVNSHKRESKQ